MNLATPRIQSTSPLRPPVANGYQPAWRWALAGKLTGQARIPRQYFTRDPYLGRIINYASCDRVGNSPARSEKLRLSDPLMDDAHSIYVRASYERWFVEAMILGRALPEEISRHYPLSVELIEMYEAVFFDVRDLLKYPGFVPTLLGPMNVMWQGSCPDFLWKKIAWTLGPEMLLRFLGVNRDLSPMHWKSLRNFVRDELAVKSMEAVMAIRPNPENAMDILRTQASIEAHDAALNVTSSSEAAGMVNGMFAAITDLIGGKLVLDDPGLKGRAVIPEKSLRDVIADYVLNGPDDEQDSQ